MYITINDVIGEKELTCLIQFTLIGRPQKGPTGPWTLLGSPRKLQLLACLAIMFRTG